MTKSKTLLFPPIIFHHPHHPRPPRQVLTEILENNQPSLCMFTIRIDINGFRNNEYAYHPNDDDDDLEQQSLMAENRR